MSRAPATHAGDRDEVPLTDPRWLYELKYDGSRAIIEVSLNGQVRIWSRLGKEKTVQFPEVIRVLGQQGRRLKRPMVLDGEIVALDSQGEAGQLSVPPGPHSSVPLQSEHAHKRSGLEMLIACRLPLRPSSTALKRYAY